MGSCVHGGAISIVFLLLLCLGEGNVVNLALLLNLAPETDTFTSSLISLARVRNGIGPNFKGDRRTRIRLNSTTDDNKISVQLCV